ncbi:MAG: phosphoribosylformylglycinamidine synthase I [Candidatus Melainabacteria bacterium]|nr:phosphoribosylformylglycinamidine synthase I [Candidatus Melainabacteria bacterium]MBI3308766.1 phosphoribosylformylglycinamidine synthase I [Candidatus Melainabacteria bacterium]
MKFAVVIFPGSNCDRDCTYVLKDVFKQEVVEIFHTEKELSKETDCVVLPGGFTYGDYLRAGSIAGFSKIIPAIKDFANKGGLVIGICNGFQILCEIGLLPGALAKNKSLSFVCDEVYLKVVNNKTPFTSLYKKDEIIRLPIAHGDGRYTANNVDESQIIFKYCDKDGNITEDSNPNGSMLNIAGITNSLSPNSYLLTSNILGLMPHPERACESILGSKDGKKLFESIINTQVLAGKN